METIINGMDIMIDSPQYGVGIEQFKQDMVSGPWGEKGRERGGRGGEGKGREVPGPEPSAGAKCEQTYCYLGSKHSRFQVGRRKHVVQEPMPCTHYGY